APLAAAVCPGAAADDQELVAQKRIDAWQTQISPKGLSRPTGFASATWRRATGLRFSISTAAAGCALAGRMSYWRGTFASSPLRCRDSAHRPKTPAHGQWPISD